MTPKLEARLHELEELAKTFNLDPFPVAWEEVPREIIWDIASYGLPTRMSHWSFGRSFTHQKTYGEMGLGKIYELIINNNPSYAFLDDTNSDVANLLIIAHCIGHSDFFKNNICFAKTDRNMVNQAATNAIIISEMKEKYGVDEVEDWMDIAFAIDRHIDIGLGENRSLYPPPEHSFQVLQPLPYADLHGESEKPQVKTVIKNEKFPPHPEKDLLWFLINYANMLPWQKEILTIIRSESFYFYPQFMTKIMNEGWASFWHAELILNYHNITPEEHLEFAKLNASVVNPGSPLKINPYYLGFRLFKDIKARWDKYYEAGQKDSNFLASDALEMYDEDGRVIKSKLTGYQKMRRVMMEDDDISFVREYLTKELAEDMHLFSYGYQNKDRGSDLVMKSRDLKAICDAITGKLNNYGAPLITVESVKSNDGTLMLEHCKAENSPLDEQYMKETLKYIFKVWKKPVKIRSYNRFGHEIVYNYAEAGLTTDRFNGSEKSFDLKM